MPRSGHHLVHRLLLAHFGEAFGYCSFYEPWEHDSFETCCKAFPCMKAPTSGYSLFLQKSHDMQLSDPIIEEGKYLVQIRAPVPRLFSNFKLFIRHHPAKNTEAGFRSFAKTQALYYTLFWEKWVTSGVGHVMPYESLIKSPYEALTAFYRAIGISFDDGKLVRAIQTEMGRKSVIGGSFKEANLKAHPFYDVGWAQEYTAQIARACKGFDAHCGEHA